MDRVDTKQYVLVNAILSFRLGIVIRDALCFFLTQIDICGTLKILG
jgi:hypothetical protein